MRRSTIILLLIIPSLSFGQGYKLNFTIEGIEDSIAYLGYHFGDQKYIQDTSQIIDGQIHFEGKENLIPGVYFLYTPKTFIEFIVDDQQFSIKAKSPDYIQTVEAEKSPMNQAFFDLERFNVAKQKEVKELNEKLEKANVEDKEQIRKQLVNLNEEAAKYQSDLVINHTTDFLGKFILALQKPKVPDSIGMNAEDKEFARFIYYKKHFFDNFDLSDESLLRSPVYQSMLTEYLEKLTKQDPDSLIKSADFILSQAQKTEATLRYTLVTLSNKYESADIMGFDKVFVYIVENYYLSGKAQWADDELLNRLGTRINQIKPGLIGNSAPPLTLLDPNLKTIDLDQIEASYIILYFYDPDCGHCKKKTPTLVSYYPELKQKNVEIFAVDINTDIDKWKDFIKTNKMTFLNGSDPYAQSNFRYEYDIQSTPTVYVLDQNKTIVGRRIDVDQLPGFIDYLLNKE